MGKRKLLRRKSFPPEVVMAELAELVGTYDVVAEFPLGDDWHCWSSKLDEAGKPYRKCKAEASGIGPFPMKGHESPSKVKPWRDVEFGCAEDLAAARRLVAKFKKLGIPGLRTSIWTWAFGRKRGEIVRKRIRATPGRK